MVYMVDSTSVIVVVLVGLAVFVLVAYLLVRLFTHSSKRDSEMEPTPDSES